MARGPLRAFALALSLSIAGCLVAPPKDDSGDASDLSLDGTTGPDTSVEGGPPADSSVSPPDSGADGAPACGPSNCPTGCCDSTGTCVRGAAVTACGSGGAQCHACAAGEACNGQACTCGGSACAGCCAGGGTCQGVGGQSASSCGTGGGACTPCSLASATAACSAGICEVGSCSAGFGDCDNVPSNGCETNLNTSTTYCGACGSGHSCPSGASCSNGTCACPAGQTNCNGTCTSTQGTDPANCGSCGHGCLGGSCSGGVCQRWTVANASVTSNPFYLAADATNLYWADDGLHAVLQVPIAQAGATPVTLVSNALLVYFQGLVVSGSTLAFTTDDSAILTTASLWTAKVGVPNQSLSPLDTFAGSSNPGTVSGPAFNSGGTTIYIAEDPEDSGGNHTTNTTLYACPTGTANACAVLTSVASNSVGGPVVSGNSVFFDDYSNNTVEQFALPSGPLNKTYVSPIPLTPTVMAADSSRVYFAYNGDGTMQTVTTEGIVNNSTNGSAQPQGFANTTGSAAGLASDGKFLYFDWINYNNNPPTGAIQYAPVGGGSVSTLYTGSQPRAVVAANGAVYWIDGTNIYGQRFP